jgi:hypothetical protein
MPRYEIRTEDGRVVEFESQNDLNENQLRDYLGQAFPPKTGALTKAALGAGAGILQDLGPGMVKTLGVLSELGAAYPEMPPPPGTAAYEHEAERILRKPSETVKAVAENPIVKAAETARQFYQEAIPTTPQEEESLWYQVPREAAAMSKYPVLGALAPVEIGLESFANHLINDFEEYKKNFGEEEAARIAIDRGITSGMMQAAVFEFLPPVLRKAGEKYFIDKLGVQGFKRWMAGRAASMGQTGAVLEAAAIPENLISGRPAFEDWQRPLIAGGLLGAISPYGRTRAERAGKFAQRFERPAASNDEKREWLQHTKTTLDETGHKWRFVDTGLPGATQDVTHTLPSGEIVVSRPQLIKYLNNYIDPKVDPLKAIERLVVEESTHAAAFKLFDADVKAKGFWRAFTYIERAALGRIILGERPTDPEAAKLWDARKNNEKYLGMEASRYLMQKLSGMGTSEMSALKQQGEIIIPTMDRIVAMTRWMRKAFKTEANKSQLEYLDAVEAKAEEIRKGAQDASKVTGAEKVGIRGKGGEVGTKAPLRQPREAAQAQEAKGLEGKEEVLLTDEQRQQLSQLGYSAEDIGQFTPEQAASVIEVKAAKPKPKVEAKAAAPRRKGEAPLNPENPHAMALGKARNDVVYLERKADLDPTFEDDLAEARKRVAEIQKDYNKAERGLPPVVTQGARAQAPSPVSTVTGAVTSGEPVIAETKLAVPPSQARPKGPAELAWEQNNEAMRRKMLAGERIERADRQRMSALFREAMKENPDIALRGAALTMKGAGAVNKEGRRRTLTPAVRSDENPNIWMAGKSHADARLRMMGEINEFSGKPQNEGWVDENNVFHPRKEALQIFKDITGIEKPDLTNPEGLSSEDFGLNKIDPGEWFNVEQRYDVKPEAGAAGLTMKGPPSEAVDKFESFLAAEPFDAKAAKASVVDTGLKLSSIEELNQVADLREKYAPKPEDSFEKKMAGMLKSSQFPREVIEIATNFGSQSESPRWQLGPRPLDWRNNPEVAKWIVDNADRMGWSKNESLNEVRAAVAAQSPGVVMKGRTVPPYTREEALEVAKQVFPDHPPGALGPFIDKIVGQPKEKQDAYINYVRQKIEEDKLRTSVVDRLMKQQSEHAEVQEKIAAGTVRQVPLPPDVEAGLVMSMHAYWKDIVQPIAAGKPLEVEEVTTTKKGLVKGKEVPLLKLGTQEPKISKKTGEVIPPSAQKIRYRLPDPMEWLELVRMPPQTGGQPNRYVMQATDRQLLSMYDRHWEDFLHNAPSDTLEQLRKGYRLDRGDLRGIIIEPELDPVLRIFHDFKTGAIDKDNMKLMAQEMGIEPKGKDWKNQVLNNLLDRVRPKLFELALANELDPTVPDVGEILLNRLFKAKIKRGREYLEFIKRGETSAQIEALSREYNKAVNAMRRRRARLERMLLQRGASEMFIAPKSPHRNKINLNDFQWTKVKNDVGSYAQFAELPEAASLAADMDILESQVKWLDTSYDLDTLNEWLVQGEGGRGAGETKRVTFLYDTKTRNVEAVSTYQHQRSKKAMIYDPTGEPGRRDRDHLRITQLPKRYRFLGSAQLEYPIGYFHQRWSTDESSSGLKKFWLEVGELANAYGDGTGVGRRARKARAKKTEEQLAAEEEERYALDEQERAAAEELDQLEQRESDEARADVKEMADEGEFTIRELAGYQRRFERLAELEAMTEAGEEIGPKVGGRIGPFEQEALRQWEEREARGLMALEQRTKYLDAVDYNEARELANLFLRYKVSTESPALFIADMAGVLEHIRGKEAKPERPGVVGKFQKRAASKLENIRTVDYGRDLSLLSAIRKIAINFYHKRTRGTGLLEEIKESAEAAGEPVVKHRRKFLKRLQQEAFENALRTIYELHASVRSEVAQYPKRSGKYKQSYTHEAYPLYPDIYASRVVERFGENVDRNLAALSASPKRSAARAVKAVTAADRLGDINLPDWVVSPNKEVAETRKEWLKTGAGQSWLRSPDGQKWLTDAAELMISHRSIDARLSGEKAIVRELTRKKLPSIPARPLEPRLRQEELFPGWVTQVGQEARAQIKERAKGIARPRWPAEPLTSQLAATTDLNKVAMTLSNLDNPIAPGKDRFNPITVRRWIDSADGRRYLAERWGMRRKAGESIEDLHERLMKRMASSLMVEQQMRQQEAPWRAVSEATTLEQTAPGATMKEGVSARRRREEQNAALGLPPPDQPPDSYTIPELLSLGPSYFAKAGPEADPYLVRERYHRTGGKLSTEDRSLLIWWQRELQKDADTLYGDPQYGPSHPETQQAIDRWSEWSNWEAKASGHSAHEAMLMRQGVQNLDTGSWVANRRVLTERKRSRGEEPTSEEMDMLDELTSEQIEADMDVSKAEQRISKAKGDLSDVTMEVPPEQKQIVDASRDGLLDYLDSIGKGWEEGQEAPMAMRGGKMPQLSPEQMDALVANGAREMLLLSETDSMSEMEWRKKMMDKYPSSAPHLNDVWDKAQQLRDQLVAKVIGTDKATEVARRYMTRTRPTPERSKEIIQKSFAEFPRTTRISPMEAMHAWNFVEQKYFGRISDIPGTYNFDTVLKEAAKDLQIPRERLYQALVSNKRMRALTTDLARKKEKARRVREHIKDWLEQKGEPPAWTYLKAVPSLFFMDKILGHGFVGMITHASNLMFQPWAWRDYFRAWKNMYRSVHSKDFHIEMINSILRDEMYQFAVSNKVGLEINPNKFATDYDIGPWYRWLREKTYGRGFDALKRLRLDLFKTWWQALPPSLRTEQMARLIAHDVNHMTGTIKTGVHSIFNYTFFAPKLVGGQWGVMVTDPIKASGYLLNWRNATPEQIRWAAGELWHKVQMVGVYAMALAVNDGILELVAAVTGQEKKQKINWNDPKKSDFLSFKAAGFNVNVAGPLIQIIRLWADLAHIAWGTQSQLEKTETSLERSIKRLGKYGRQKFSPFSGFVADVWTAQDFTGRPLPMPWGHKNIPKRKQLRGVKAYTWPEWVSETISPIPIQEGIKELWHDMGMPKTMSEKLLRALMIAVPMAMTGARIWEDITALEGEEGELYKGPVTAY